MSTKIPSIPVYVCHLVTLCQWLWFILRAV